MRIDKFLTKTGYGTRSEAKKLITQKRVKINGKLVSKISQIVDGPVTVNGIEVIYKEFVYIMLNKPNGVISATKDTQHTTVVDLLKGYEHYDIHPIGRLDIDTTGLLILTNDGSLTHHLTSPKRDKEKTYLCTLKDPFQDDYVQKLATGIPLKDFTTKPAKVKVLNDKQCLLTITEGKYHQVKRMFLYLDNEITDLHRVSMNGLCLDEDLDIGEYRELTLEELNIIKN